MNESSPWWRPDQFARRRPFLEIRQRVLAAMRGYFARQEFAEVETPALQMLPGGEVHVQAFATELKGPRPGEKQKLYLHTSPEIAMKKLLVAGMPRIYQIAHVYRNGEQSRLHHPEFTMLEWYRAGERQGSPPLAGGDRGGVGADGAVVRNFENISCGENPPPDLTAYAKATADGVGSQTLRSPSEGGLRKVGGMLLQIQDDCIQLVRVAAHVAGRKGFSANGMTCDPYGEWEKLSVPEAFRRYAAMDLLATAPDPEKPDAALLAAEVERIGVRVASGDTWEDLFFRVMAEKIEPFLGKFRPTFLCDYPVSMAALARRNTDDARLAERMELYICGIELANGFGELTDADEQLRRLRTDMALKQKLYGESWPVDEDFIAALRYGMPESAGIALGVDRLVMLCAGAEKMDDVLWAPVSK